MTMTTTMTTVTTFLTSSLLSTRVATYTSTSYAPRWSRTSNNLYKEMVISKEVAINKHIFRYFPSAFAFWRKSGKKLIISLNCYFQIFLVNVAQESELIPPGCTSIIAAKQTNINRPRQSSRSKLCGCVETEESYNVNALIRSNQDAPVKESKKGSKNKKDRQRQ